MQNNNRQPLQPAAPSGTTIEKVPFLLTSKQLKCLASAMPGSSFQPTAGAKPHEHACVAIERAIGEARMCELFLKKTGVKTYSDWPHAPVVDIGGTWDRHARRQRGRMVTVLTSTHDYADPVRYSLRPPIGNITVLEGSAPEHKSLVNCYGSFSVHVYTLTAHDILTLVTRSVSGLHLAFMHSHESCDSKGIYQCEGSFYGGEMNWCFDGEELHVQVAGGEGYRHRLPLWLYTTRHYTGQVDGKTSHMVWSKVSVVGTSIIYGFQRTLQLPAQLEPPRFTVTSSILSSNETHGNVLDHPSAVKTKVDPRLMSMPGRLRSLISLGPFAVVGFETRPTVIVPKAYLASLARFAMYKPRTPKLQSAMSSYSNKLLESYNMSEETKLRAATVAIPMAMILNVDLEVSSTTTLAEHSWKFWHHSRALEHIFPHNGRYAIIFLLSLLTIWMFPRLSFGRTRFLDTFFAFFPTNLVYTASLFAVDPFSAIVHLIGHWLDFIPFLAFAEESHKRHYGPHALTWFEFTQYLCVFDEVPLLELLIVRFIAVYQHYRWTQMSLFGACLAHTFWNVVVSHVHPAFLFFVMFVALDVCEIPDLQESLAQDGFAGRTASGVSAFDDIVTQARGKVRNAFTKFIPSLEPERPVRVGNTVLAFQVPYPARVHRTTPANLREAIQYRAQLENCDHPSTEASFRAFLLDFLATHVQRKFHVIAFSDWLSTQPSSNRSRLQDAYDSLFTVGINNKDFHSQIFGKKETLFGLDKPGEPDRDKVQRAITTRSDRFKVLLGPYCYSLSKHLATQFPPDSALCYCVGFTAEQIGSWFDSALVDQPVLVEIDCSGWDSTMGNDKLETEVQMFEFFGASRFRPHPAVNLSVSDLMRCSVNKSGVSRYGDVYTTVGTRASGDYYTTCGTTPRNLLQSLKTYCDAYRVSHSEVMASKCIRVIAGGDDMLAIHPARQPSLRHVVPSSYRETKRGGLLSTEVKCEAAYTAHLGATGLGLLNKPLPVAQPICLLEPHDEKSVTCDWDAGYSSVGFVPKTKIHRDPVHATFYSGRPWPTAEGKTVWGPKIGRALSKAGSILGEKDVSLLRGIAISNSISHAHVPVLRKLWPIVLRRIGAKGPVKTTRDMAYAVRTTTAYHAHPETSVMVHMLHGTSMEELELGLDSLTVGPLPFDLTGDPLLAMIFESDM